MIVRVLTVVAFLAGGCASVPSVEHPALDIPLPENWTIQELPHGQLTVTWWEDFGDDGLATAVDLALSQNYDLRAAAARLEQAAATTRVAEGDLQPIVQGIFDGSRRKQNFIGFPIPGGEDQVLSTVSTNTGISLDVSWEIDLWGRLRNTARAALADLQASSADLRGAQLSIAGQTTKAWFAIAEAQQQVDLSLETVQSFRSAAQQVRDRFEVGIRPALDLRLALLNLSNAEAQLQQRRQQFHGATRQLELLLGQYADGVFDTPAKLPQLTPPVPTGVPADLVARRPDLVAAERELTAFLIRADVARTNLLPRLSLTGATGTATDGLRSLIDGDFGVWRLLGNVVAPLWQGGRLRAQVDLAEARVAEALASYANAALTAYAEVETALSAEEFFVERERHLTESTLQARAAERLAEERYRAGLETYTTVLDSQRSAVNAEAELITARRIRLENRVNLYLALGGGFEGFETPIQFPGSEGQ
jgi:NodT family efflux transporter outer membrane factor (OMF) lipoprotein